MILNKKQIEKKDAKVIYYLLILSIIPFLGVLAACTILVLGIIVIYRYKKVSVLAIGCLSIGISVAITSFLINYMGFNKSAQNGMAKVVLNQLNTLVTNIEFYKFQNGYYPDSLQQLKSSDLNGPIIEDPFLIYSKSKDQLNFYYEKADSNYKLFSSGIDRTPNTTDDIYPDIKPGKSKLGYISK